MAGTAHFFFAHQDDEFGVFHAIEQEIAKGRVVQCWYMTDGSGRNADSAHRNAESLGVLSRLNIPGGHVHFLGDLHGFRDGSLYKTMTNAASVLKETLTVSADDTLYGPAFEGGHVDHDALHLILLKYLRKLPPGQRPDFWQHPLYNAWRCPKPFFNVLKPLPDNGPVERTHIPLVKRAAYLGLCLRYPSQWRAWIGLWPFVALAYAIDGHQSLQRAGHISSPLSRPHEGELYYERRTGVRWAEFKEYADCFLSDGAA